MTSRIAIALATASFGIAGAALPDAAVAQTAADLVGSWAVVSVDNVSPDGKRSPAFGPNPGCKARRRGPGSGSLREFIERN